MHTRLTADTGLVRHNDSRRAAPSASAPHSDLRDPATGRRCGTRRHAAFSPSGALAATRRFRRGLLSALLGLPLLFGFAASAQERQVLVSNIGQSDGTAVPYDDHVQGFTTGGNSAGYTIEDVDVEFASMGGFDAIHNLSMSMNVWLRKSHTCEWTRKTNQGRRVARRGKLRGNMVQRAEGCHQPGPA